MKFMLEQALTNADGSGTNTVTSGIYDIRFSYGYSVQFVFSGGTPTGTAKVQGSINQTSWTDITSVAVTATGVTADNKDAIYYPYLRVTYTGTAGTGVVVNAYLCTKGA
jgi:hypothetical protein